MAYYGGYQGQGQGQPNWQQNGQQPPQGYHNPHPQFPYVCDSAWSAVDQISPQQGFAYPNQQPPGQYGYQHV